MSYSAKPRQENVWISDISGVQAMVIRNPLDLRIEERFAQSETLYFTIRADDPKAAYVAEDLGIRWRDRFYFVFETTKRRGRDGAALIDVECPAIWNRLATRKRVGTFTLDAVTVPAGLKAILDGTGWTAVVTDPTINIAAPWTLVGNDASVLDLVRKWAKITGTEVGFDTVARSVQLYTSVGVERGVGFRYGRNVTQVLRRANPPRFTRLYPFGKDDLSIAGLTPGNVAYVEDFSFYTNQGITLPEAQANYLREEIWSDSSFVVDADLYAAAQERIAGGAQPLIAYEMAVVDLAELTGIASDRYGIGDSVMVVDGDLGFDIVTRVVRVIRRPLEPARSEVELSYLPPIVPDPNVGGARSDTTEEWVLFEKRSPTARRIRAGTTILGRLDLNTIPDAEWVVGFSLNGVGVGTGTVTITVVDDETDDVLYPPITLDVVNGKPVTHSFTFGERDVPAASYSIVVRGQSSGAGIGANIDALGANLWVLARGTTQQTITLPNSQVFTFTGAVQQFTVPDDVSEILIEAIGGIGETFAPAVAGAGGKVTARFAVTAGSVLDVYVGGHGGNATALGWPNGGSGDQTGAGNKGGNGGGSSDVRASGAAFAASWIVAAGGGASGFSYANPMQGGSAGFFLGTNGSGGNNPGLGATQEAGGAAGSGGSPGAANDGGDAGDTTNSFRGPGGGGGGGWFGGGGAGTAPFNGSGGEAGPGGGASGWVGDGAFDVDYEDAFNNIQDTDGTVTISWETPAE